MVKLFRTLAIILLFCSTAAYAQPQAAPTPAGAPANPAAPATPAATPGASAASAMSAVPGMTTEELNKPFEGSFFLTPLEIAAIQQALKGKVMKGVADEMSPVIPARRVIRVAGVFYRSPKDWVVWMNNQKVTPDNLLPEIVDISVKPSSKVSLQWYDVGLNKVLSITLRPHQTYDITTGILLPQ